jgi:hypothetical protein
MFNYAHPEVLADTQWLAEYLRNPNMRIIEVDMTPDRYRTPAYRLLWGGPLGGFFAVGASFW